MSGIKGKSGVYQHKPLSDKTKQKMREIALKDGRRPDFSGRKHSEESKQKIRLAKLGISSNRKNYRHSEETLKRLSESHKGYIMPESQKRKISEALKGEKSYLWRGGISKNPYPNEFNSILKLKIRTRDNFICCLCGRTEREELEELNRILCVNHIDFNKQNCKKDNLNTLCLRCNVKINRDRDYWTNYFLSLEAK